MKRSRLTTNCALAIIVVLLSAGSVLADKPEGKGKGKGNSSERHERSGRGDHDQDSRGNKHERGSRKHFEERHYAIVNEYYDQQLGGHCPPGLAKKRNGCMPPGQARKWQVGRSLPRDVIFYEVPQQIVIQIGPRPQVTATFGSRETS